MRNKQKVFGWALLWLFAAILSFSFLAPEATPQSAEKSQLVIQKDNTTDYTGDLLRSSEGHQESTKHEDYGNEFTQVEGYHSESVNVRSAQILELEQASRTESGLYLLHSRLSI